MCYNPINHIRSDNYPYLYQHKYLLRPEYKPLHHGYLKIFMNYIDGRAIYFKILQYFSLTPFYSDICKDVLICIGGFNTDWCFFKLGLNEFTTQFGADFTYCITQICHFIKYIHYLIHGYTVVGQMCHFIIKMGVNLYSFMYLLPIKE